MVMHVLLHFVPLSLRWKLSLRKWKRTNRNMKPSWRSMHSCWTSEQPESGYVLWKLSIVNIEYWSAHLTYGPKFISFDSHHCIPHSFYCRNWRLSWEMWHMGQGNTVSRLRVKKRRYCRSFWWHRTSICGPVFFSSMIYIVVVSGTNDHVIVLLILKFVDFLYC